MVEVIKEKNSTCNSCMKQNAYKILCMPNEHCGCVIYLCEDCMQKMIGQFAIEKEKEND